ncbi:MAG: nicotinate (nicotinamide) nucleotide adenylyltransferase [Labilithrix sp.]|nr:nicotinate (nicotinamide) nucleotide adenylyltransferase [Labilithrix sp.]
MRRRRHRRHRRGVGRRADHDLRLHRQADAARGAHRPARSEDARPGHAVAGAARARGSRNGRGRVSGVTGIFGGSFNPPHLAHVLALAVVHARFEVERLLVVPTYQHPFAKSLAPYDDRVRMCELAMGFLPRVEVSRVEEELGGESRTLRTLEHLRAKHPEWNMRFVMGADLMAESSKWYAFDKISAIAPPIVLGRVGVAYEGAPPAILPAISSTEVRTMMGEERWDELAELVPREVLAHARTRGLYRS